MAAALASAGPATYEEILRDSGATLAIFRVPGRPAPTEVTVPELRAYHEGWLAYVTGRWSDPGAAVGSLFTAQEVAHMEDVRRVFIGAQVAAVLAAGALALLAAAAWRGGRLARLARDGALAASVGVGAIGAAAALAFEPVFLLFHQIFFPQGNFLFDPATSNLLALYPQAYWWGLTLRIGAAFVVGALALALLAHLALRRERHRSDAAGRSLDPRLTPS